MSKNRSSIRALTEGAIMIALAEILSFLPLYKLPWGGSIDLAMFPILLFCSRWGLGPGLLVSFAHATLQTLFEGGIAIGWQSIIGDYLVAYTVLGLAGLFKGKFWLGATVACTARFLVHYVVGATIWAEYMPGTFFGMTMTTPWFYSALYNAAYMLPDLCFRITVIPGASFAKYFTRYNAFASSARVRFSFAVRDTPFSAITVRDAAAQVGTASSLSARVCNAASDTERSSAF